MEHLAFAILLSAAAGATIPIGAALAAITAHDASDRDLTTLTHVAAAFGAGALVSAIAFVLVPEGVERLPATVAVGAFLLGGLVFYGVDLILDRMGGHGAMFLAMMLDYIPEAIALGALIAGDPFVAILTAALIALQNLPEGFSAYREMMGVGSASGRRLFLLFLVMVPVGPLAALAGIVYFAPNPGALGAMMMFAAGGILYLLLQDVAPKARATQSFAPPLGAVAGFALGLAGSLALA